MRTVLFAACAALAFASMAHAQTMGNVTGNAPQVGVSDTAAGTITQALSRADGGNATSSGGISSATGGTASGNGGNANAGGATVLENYQRAPVASALASPLTFSQGTCYVSASAGGQGITFGLSMAVPFEDKACTARATAQALNALGEREAALKYLAAHDPGVRAALAK